MAWVLTIPDIVESEPMISFTVQPDGVTFGIVIAIDDTAVRLTRANANGEEIPLVVLTTDADILALDSVFVTESMFNDHESVAQFTLVAQGVRRP
ncbi:MAG: hypothetical protein ACXV8L_12810 [Ilumatobacteraceae bacterium]